MTYYNYDEKGHLVECNRPLTVSSGWALTVIGAIAGIALICFLKLCAIGGTLARLDKDVQKIKHPFEHFVITNKGSKNPDLIFDVDPNSGRCTIFGLKEEPGLDKGGE